MSRKTEWMMENIMDMEGDVTRYSELVKRNPSNYRTLSEFLAPKATGMKKETLAKQLGVSLQTLNNWEKQGIPSLEQAVYVAVVRKLSLKEANQFFSKHAGLRELYAADRFDIRYMYLLTHREWLEERYPYQEDETVKDWVNRVLGLLEKEGLPDTQAVSQASVQADSPRVATEYFMETLLGGNLEAVNQLPFRSAGQKAYAYLESYVKGTPFQKNHGNCWIDDSDGNRVRPARTLLNPYLKEERDHYKSFLKKLKAGATIHRDELIKLAMMLCMTKGQTDELLQLCGEAPLSARNLYEGALLVSWFFLSDAVQEKLEAGETQEEFEAGGPKDLQVLLSEQVERCLTDIPKGMGKQLREMPGWYLPKERRERRMEKRRLSFILDKLTTEMSEIWECAIQENRMMANCSFVNMVHAALKTDGYRELDRGVDAFLLEQIRRIQTLWWAEIQKDCLPGEKSIRDQLCLKLVDPINSYYAEMYAPKKKGKMRSGERTAD